MPPGHIELWIPELDMKAGLMLDMGEEMKGLHLPGGLLSEMKTHLSFFLNAQGAGVKAVNQILVAKCGNPNETFVSYAFTSPGWVFFAKDNYVHFGLYLRNATFMKPYKV